jgi:hypothetical protein
MDDLMQMTFGMNVSHGGAGMTSTQTDFYRVLDIASNASRLEIREAYLRLKGTYGAGSAALYSLIDEDEAARQMAEIEEAFRTLNDDHLRREYDQRLGLGQRDELGRQGASSLSPAAAMPPAQAAMSPVAGMNTGHDTERFLRMREASYSLSSQVGGPVSDSMIGTGTGERAQRPSLAIIKLRASQAGSADMHEKMRELVASGDPGDGDLYRQLREVCGVSADEIQERTKVSIGYIDAIETNRFERLPQAVYVKGFLASYFKYLDVPGFDKLVTAFAARLTDWQANKKN